jgi:hypothetical protein
MAQKVSSEAESSPLLVKGGLVKLDLFGGDSITLPKYFGFVHDPTGEHCSRCDIYIAEYHISNPTVTHVSPKVASIARAYFGDLENLTEGTVELPTGPWHRVGQVVQIWYDRYGDRKGPYFHPFKTPVDLHRQAHGEAYLLSLPDRCVVDSHGFVWP